LVGLRNPTFGGVIVLKLFDPSYGFEVTDFEIAIFLAKLALDISKSFRSMTHPQSGVSKAKLSFWSP